MRSWWPISRFDCVKPIRTGSFASASSLERLLQPRDAPVLRFSWRIWEEGAGEAREPATTAARTMILVDKRIVVVVVRKGRVAQRCDVMGIGTWVDIGEIYMTKFLDRDCKETVTVNQWVDWDGEPRGWIVHLHSFYFKLSKTSLTFTIWCWQCQYREVLYLVVSCLYECLEYCCSIRSTKLAYGRAAIASGSECFCLLLQQQLVSGKVLHGHRLGLRLCCETAGQLCPLLGSKDSFTIDPVSWPWSLSNGYRKVRRKIQQWIIPNMNDDLDNEPCAIPAKSKYLNPGVTQGGDAWMAEAVAIGWRFRNACHCGSHPSCRK